MKFIILMSQCRKACFTWNNYPEDWVFRLETYFNEGTVQYMCGGQELAPTTGTPHIQGYMSWKNPTRYAALAKRFHCTFLTANGSDAQNRAYCSKDNNNFREWGTPKDEAKNQGKHGIKGKAFGKEGGDLEKKRWEDALKAARENRIEDIPADIYIRHCRNIEYIRAQNEPRPEDLDGELKNLWIHGPAGVGKSKVARLIGQRSFYCKNLNKWWDNYKGEPFVIIDEVSTKNADWMGDLLKIWCDRYAFNAEMKGSTKNIRPKCIIVTSNYSINELWPPNNDLALNEAIVRRFHQTQMLALGGKWSMKNLEEFAEQNIKKYDLAQYKQVAKPKPPTPTPEDDAASVELHEEEVEEPTGFNFREEEEDIDYLLNLEF